MIILPAVDMIAGKPVRLYQGDYGKAEVVAESVAGTILSFADDGAEYIHMVDLDGAKEGKRKNAETVVECARSVNVPIEIGGGIRTMEDISFYLDNGISRVILGTSAIRDEDLLKKAVSLYGEKIAVGMDCRNGYAAASGWLEESSLYYLDFAKHLEEIGVKNIIFTDISRDGTLTGPNLEMLEALSRTVSVDITASGGIHTIEDVIALRRLGLYGAIIGKAIYTGDISLKDAIREGKEDIC